MLQAPSDALMITLAGGMPATNTGDATAPAGFAALMQTLLGQGATADGKAKADLLSALPVPAKDADDDAPATTGADLVAAALALLQASGATIEVPKTGAQPAQPTASVGDATGGSTAPAPTQLSLTVSAEAQVALPESAQTRTADVLPAATATAATPALPLPPTEDAASSATAPISDALVQALTSATAAPVAKTETASAPDRDRKTDKDAASPAPPPGDPPQTQTAEISVVRSVGNAQQDNNTTGQDSAKSDTSPASIQVTTKASGKNSVTAAFSSAVTDVRDNTAPAAADMAGSAPAPAPQLPPAVEHVATTVLQQVEQGGGEAKIHLHPAELGEVVIRVHADGDHVRVEIHADRSEAMNLLRDHTQDLSNLLGSRGLNLSDVYVGVGGQNQENQRDGQQAASQANNKPENSEFAALMGIDSTPAAGNFNRLRAAYNPDGALSYRV